MPVYCKDVFRKSSGIALALVCLMPFASDESRAADVLSFLPQNVLGYAVVKNIAAADEKFTQLANLFQFTIRSPLQLAKVITGLSDGVDLNGDGVFAYLANGVTPTDPIPLVLLPVTDYANFATAVGGDSTGEICRIRIAEVELLVARLASYALVMNVEHRDTMRQLLATPPDTQADSFTEWTGSNDVSLVLTRYGFFQIARHGWFIGSTDEEDVLAEDEFGEIAVPQTMRRRKSLPVVDFARRHFLKVGLGVSIDKANDVKVRWKTEFVNPVASHDDSAKKTEQPLVGFATKPYALVGGGELPINANDLLAEFMMQLSLQDAQHQGRSNFSRRDWAAERKSWDLSLSGVSAVSLLLAPPSEGDSLLSSLFVRLTVDDSAAYLTSLTQAYELSNELTHKSQSDIKILYRIEPKDIGQTEGIAIVSDLDEATGDTNVDAWQMLLTACLGADHDFAIYCSPTDDKHVCIGLQSIEKLIIFSDRFAKGEKGLSDQPSVQKTLKLMEEDVPFIQLVNPQGLLEIAQAWMKAIMILSPPPQLPLLASAPPIGVTISSDQRGWRGEFVFPWGSLQSLAKFVADLEELLH